MTEVGRAEAEQRARLKRLAATAGLGVAISLVLLKLVAAVWSGSLAVLASLVDSMADVGGSAVTYFSVRISQLPPDRAHRFGHGKAESLSALAQATVVMASAIFIVIDAIRAVGNSEQVTATGPALVVIVFSTLVTAALVAFQRSVVQRTGSQAIAADRLHFTSDLATNLAVILSLVLVQLFGWRWIDPAFGAAIALVLIWGACRIAAAAVRTLMDHELPTASRDNIKAIVMAHPEVQGMHDLRTRESGSTTFIELHIELDPEMTVAAAHKVTDALEAELGAAFPESGIIIHQEPAGLDDPRLDHVIAQAKVGAVTAREGVAS